MTDWNARQRINESEAHVKRNEARISAIEHRIEAMERVVAQLVRRLPIAPPHAHEDN